MKKEQLLTNMTPELADQILALINDRPKVNEGEKYLYIDTRIITAPYGVISQMEVKHACSRNLSGAAWGVYMYILTTCSGRVSLKGTEIGGRQIMMGTGYSKATVYRACEQLIKADLIRPSARSKNRRAWLLCNPHSDDIQDQAKEEELKNAQRESDVQNSVLEKNQAVNRLLKEPVNSFNSKTEKRDTFIRFETNTNNDQLPIDSNWRQKSASDFDRQYESSEFDRLLPYLDMHFQQTLEALINSNLSDHEADRTYWTKQRLKAVDYRGDAEIQGHPTEEHDLHIKFIDQQLAKIGALSEQENLLVLWSSHPDRVADDLAHRRTSKTCLLRLWGWDGTQSTKKLTKYILRYVSERARWLQNRG